MSREPVSPELTAARLIRLKDELVQEGVPIAEATYFPSALGRSWDATLDVLCDEITFARYIELHEGYRPSYGCYIVENIAEATRILELDESTEGETEPTVDELRPFADGEQTFLLRDLSGAVRLVPMAAGEQLDRLATARDLSGVCVQRQPDGRIHILTDSIVCISDGFDWRWLVTVSQMLPDIVPRLDLPSGLEVQVTSALREILDVCVHVLSPRGIGATLVWRVTEEVLGRFSNAPVDMPVSLNLLNLGDRYSIASLLASVDGACVVSRDGQVLNYWAILDPSDQAKDLVAEMGGTRHTSAKRYSFDEPGSLVMVVSEDGPVTVFSDGAMLARFVDASRENGTPWSRRLPLDEGAEVIRQSHELPCVKCGKTLVVDVAQHDSADGEHQVICPVCKSEAFPLFQNVLDVETRVVKAWSVTQ